MLGQLFIVAAPSGGGKTSLVQQLIQLMPNVEVSVSHTTREQRSGEVEGKHYFFTSEDEFKKKVKAGAFVEHALVYGHYYGTSHEQINRRLNRGIDVVLDIDWQGAQQLRKRFKNAVSIFILPPSVDTLKHRLTERARDDAAVIKDRMEKAHDEMQHFSEFDYLIINQDFDVALSDLMAIVKASRLKASIQAQRHHQLLSLLTE